MRKFLLLLLIALTLNASAGNTPLHVFDCEAGINATELAKVITGPGGSGGNEFIEKYGMPLTNVFRLPTNWPVLEECDCIFLPDGNIECPGCPPQYSRAWRHNVCIGAEISFSQSAYGYNVRFVHGETALSTAPSHLSLAYHVEIEPPGEEEQDKRKDEWIDEGGSFDTPPVNNVSTPFLERICNAGQEKYWHSNYHVNKPCTIQGQQHILHRWFLEEGETPSSLRRFKTPEINSIDSIPDRYYSDNGYDVYVVPFGGMKTEAFGGMQLFRDIGEAIQCYVSCTGPLEPRAGEVQELRLLKGTRNGREYFYFDPDTASEKCMGVEGEPYVGCYNVSSAHYAFVDKLFFPDTMESVQADWLIRVFGRNEDPSADTQPKLLFQLPLLPMKGTLPEVNFDYKVDSFTGEDVIVSFDPHAVSQEGSIEGFAWDLGDGREYSRTEDGEVFFRFEPGYYTVSMTAYDDQGFRSRKIRTINVSPEALGFSE